MHGIVTHNDFSDLKNVLRNEFTRRNMSLPTNDSYNVTPANSVVIYKEHASKLLADVAQMDSSRNYSINTQGVIASSDFSATITYIQTLMNQNLKN